MPGPSGPGMVNERAISGAIPGTLCMPCTLANAISCLVLPITPTLWALYLDARSYAFARRRYTYLPTIIHKCALRPRTNLQVSNTPGLLIDPSSGVSPHQLVVKPRYDALLGSCSALINAT